MLKLFLNLEERCTRFQAGCTNGEVPVEFEEASQPSMHVVHEDRECCRRANRLPHVPKFEFGTLLL